MPGRDQSFARFRAFRNGEYSLKILVREQTRHAFFPTADLEFFRVLLWRPLPWNPELLPHLIECHQMSVELGIRQDTVTIKNQASLHTFFRPFRRCRRSP